MDSFQEPKTMLKVRFVVLSGMILVAAASRLIPHPPNFVPIAAIALFGGAHFSDKRMAFLIPLAAMFLSDLAIGLHSLIPVVYATFAIIVCIGLWLRSRRRVFPIASAALVCSILFFLVTNFGVWAFGAMYPKTMEGLIACYMAAIPFFTNTLLGNAFYTAALFGCFALAERWFPVLQEPSLSPAK